MSQDLEKQEEMDAQLRAVRKLITRKRRDVEVLIADKRDFYEELFQINEIEPELEWLEERRGLAQKEDGTGQSTPTGLREQDADSLRHVQSLIDNIRVPDPKKIWQAEFREAVWG